MRYHRLGEADFELPVVTFGAWAIGGLFWGGTDDDEAVKAIQAAIDHDVTAIDTAPIYGCGHSETIVGKAIAGRQDKVRILTKCSLRWDLEKGEFYFTLKAPDGSDVTCYRNGKAESILYECEQSLKRLNTDVIDLYQVHWPTESAPQEETIGAMVKLKEQGKIRAIGVSNYGPDHLAEARKHADVVSNQVKYNLIERNIEKATLPYCQDHNIGVIAYSPMLMGLLTGKVTMDRTFPETDVRSTHPWFKPENRRRVLDTLDQIRGIADNHEITLAQLSAAWVMAQPGVTTALLGARNARQAIENAVSGDVLLSNDEVDRIRSCFESLGGPA